MSEISVGRARSLDARATPLHTLFLTQHSLMWRCVYNTWLLLIRTQNSYRNRKACSILDIAPMFLSSCRAMLQVQAGEISNPGSIELLPACREASQPCWWRLSGCCCREETVANQLSSWRWVACTSNSVSAWNYSVLLFPLLSLYSAPFLL